MAKSIQGLVEMKVVVTWQDLGISADLRSPYLWSVDVLCGSDESLSVWVILSIDDLFMDRDIELSLAGRAKYDSNRSPHRNGRQEIYFLLSSIALGKPLNGIDDVLIQPGNRCFTSPLHRALWRWNHLIIQGWCGDKGDINSGDEDVWGEDPTLLHPKY